MPDTRNDHIDTLDQVLPEKTPLFIGLGVVIDGTITYKAEDPTQRLVVLGEVRGDIYTNAILQVAQGATVHANSVISAREVVVAGKIVGKGVTIKSGLLILQPTGDVHVESIALPLGGLEHTRGGVLNGRLDMSIANEFHGDQFGPAAVPAPVVAHQPHAASARQSAIESPSLAVCADDAGAHRDHDKKVVTLGASFVAGSNVTYRGLNLGEDVTDDQPQAPAASHG